jgi:hypothetical protein
MKYFAAIALLVTCCVAIHFAQEDDPPPIILPRPEVEVPLQELVRVVSERSEEPITLDEKITGSILVVRPSKADEFDEDEAFQLLQNSLALHHQALVPADKGWKSVPFSEVYDNAPEVTRPVAEISPDWKWVRVNVTPEHTRPNQVRHLLIGIATRGAGSVKPVDDATLEICDRVDRLREMFKLLDAITAREKSEVKTYAAPAGLTDQDVILTINNHFTRTPGSIMSAKITGDGISVEVTGSARVHATVAQLVEAMTE